MRTLSPSTALIGQAGAGRPANAAGGIRAARVRPIGRKRPATAWRGAVPLQARHRQPSIPAITPRTPEFSRSGPGLPDHGSRGPGWPATRGALSRSICTRTRALNVFIPMSVHLSRPGDSAACRLGRGRASKLNPGGAGLLGLAYLRKGTGEPDTWS